MTATYTVTFYSFKGGVGRTTLLVNVAHLLAAAGERVLIWDLDLEAPGVHYFPGLEPPELWQSGFLEWLGATPPSPTATPGADWPAPSWLHKLGDRVYQPGAGSLWVLPAHGTAIDLGRAYAEVAWHALLVERPEQGLHLFTRARDALIERFQPTFLLIDARTGISDLGAFLTGFLPDCTVMVGNYSRQSTEGLRTVYVALDRFATEQAHSESHRARALERLLVASPVPVAPDAVERGRARWASGFTGVAPRSQIEVPLVENLLYAEDVLVRSAPSSDAARAYREVADALVRLRQVQVRATVPASDDGAALTLEQRAHRLLQLLGIELTTRDGEVLAHERTTLGERTYQVVCLESGAKVPRPARDEELLVIVDGHGPQRSAAPVTVRTVAELEEQLVDLRAYAATIRRGFEDSVLARGYVEPRFDGGVPAVERALAWVAGDGPRLMLVVGDDGAGKTSFTRRLAYELVHRPGAPVPIVITSRHAHPGMTLESLLQLHLNDAIGWYGKPEAILYLLRAGRILILLDGFDELSGDQLARLATPTTAPGPTAGGNRMLITARARPREPVDALTMALAPFDERQIERFLHNKLGSSAPRALAAMRRNESASQLAQRPMMLELMSADDAGFADGDRAPMTPALVCQRFIDGWTRELPARRTLVELLAFEAWRQPDNEVLLSRFHGKYATNGAAVETLDRELRTAPFVVRTGQGRYRFSHSMYLDYGMARHLLTQAAVGIDALQAALPREPLTDNVVEMFRALVATDPQRPAIARSLRAVRSDNASVLLRTR